MIYDFKFTILKRVLHLLTPFIFYFANAVAQNKEEVRIENSLEDSIIYHKVMLIPYDPLFYLSDAEIDIAEATKKDPLSIRESFRKNIDYNIKRVISKFRPCIALLSDMDSMPSLKETLISIYSKTGYRYDKPLPIPFKQADQDSVKSKKNPLAKNEEDSKIAAQYITAKRDAHYMNAILSKPSLLNELYGQYGTDVFVFVNQLEIKTNYSSCLDIANKIFKREIMLHFSVFDKEGKQLAGAFALSFFPSDSNNAFDIMKNCFPELAMFVAMCTP